jgi:hypothetical protein
MASEISQVFFEFMAQDYPRKPAALHDYQKKGRHVNMAAFAV